jgi:hypothetical protein
VLTFEAVTFGDGLTDTTFPIGTVQFLVTSNVSTDGADLFSGFFNFGVDGMFNNAGNPLQPTFNSASVDAIPEPSSLALALSVLLGAGFRRKL